MQDDPNNCGWVSREGLMRAVPKWQNRDLQDGDIDLGRVTKDISIINKKIAAALSLKQGQSLIENGRIPYGHPGCYRLRVHPDCLPREL